MSKVSIQLLRCRDKALVEAFLHTDLEASVLKEAERIWGPMRRTIARKYQREGRMAEVPQHFHWDWGAKSEDLEKVLAYRCCGIEYDDQFQGLLMISVAGKVARLAPDSGKELVYVEYLEVAPWNLPAMVDDPQFAGTGSVLLRAAVQVSHDEGFRGRIGLHALPQSESFYKDKCGMEGCGPDPSIQNLPYFEMTQEAAARFISG